MPLQIKPSSGSGSITLQATTGTTTNDTLTLPASTGTVALTASPTFTGTTTTGAQSVGGNITFSAADAGIIFNKTGALTNSTLNDYEQGTWTPSLATSSGTPTYTFQQGSYVKIGQLVRLGGLIGISNSSSLTGTIQLQLPFVAVTDSYGSAGGVSSDGVGFTWPIGGNYTLSFQINSGTQIAAIIGATSGTSAIAYNSAGVAATWYFRFSLTYKTS